MTKNTKELIKYLTGGFFCSLVIIVINELLGRYFSSSMLTCSLAFVCVIALMTVKHTVDKGTKPYNSENLAKPYWKRNWYLLLLLAFQVWMFSRMSYIHVPSLIVGLVVHGILIGGMMYFVNKKYKQLKRG